MSILRYFVILLFTAMVLGACSSSGPSRYNEARDEDSADRYGGTRFDKEEEEYDEDEAYAEEEDYQLPPEDQTEIAERTEALQRYINNTSELDADIATKRERVLMEVIRYLNTPYKYGGNSTSGIDCSAFTQNVYSNALGFKILRSARLQYSEGEEIGRGDLQFGDLVFFNTRRGVRPGHVGLYIGDDLFAHASRSRGVTISSLTKDYYRQRYMGARRYLPLEHSK